MPRYDHAREVGESEYDGVRGPVGVPKYRPRRALSASDEARLLRTTGTRDPKAPKSDRVWNGEDINKTQRQKRGEADADHRAGR